MIRDIGPNRKWVSLGHHRPGLHHMVCGYRKRGAIQVAPEGRGGGSHIRKTYIRGLVSKRKSSYLFSISTLTSFGLFSENPSSDKYHCHPGAHSLKTC